MQLVTKHGNPASKDQAVKRTRRFFKDGWNFTSYGSFIAFKADDGTVYLGHEWDHSNTTRFYRCQFLGENTAATRKKIESGEYTFPFKKVYDFPVIVKKEET
jgi:hypothetical protein